jgi:hypothetical protein
LQDHLEEQVKSLNSQNAQLRQKVSDLRIFQLENMKLKEENASLKALKKNPKGRGPTISRLMQYIPYSRDQLENKKKFLTEKFADLAKSSGLPPSDQLYSVSFLSRSGRIEEFFVQGLKMSKIKQNNFMNAQLLEMIIYWKDSNLVSNDSFHELSMLLRANGLIFPTFNELQKSISMIDENLNLFRTPGDFIGIQQSFLESFSNHLESFLNIGKFGNTDLLRVKFSSDGTRIGKRIHICAFAYCIVCDDPICRSVKLLAIVKCPERYECLKVVFENIFDELKSFKSLNVQGKTFSLEFTFGADLKIDNILYGLDSSKGKFFCLFCYCTSDERPDFSLFWSTVDPKGHPRTVQECSRNCLIKKSSKKIVQNFNCSHPPLMPFIPICNVVPDVMHLFLRITDVLLEKFVSHLLKMDNVSLSASSYDQNAMQHLAAFERFARSLNFDFDFFFDKSSHKLCFTSLPVEQRLKIFTKIDLEIFLPNFEKVKQLKFLWSEFVSLYKMMNRKLNESEILEFSDRAKRWAVIFSSDVYLSRDVTPYVHILVYHIADAMRLHGDLSLYSQQQFEFLNNTLTQQFFRATNHRNVMAFEQIFAKQARMTYLQSTCKRIKRKYKC